MAATAPLPELGFREKFELLAAAAKRGDLGAAMVAVYGVILERANRVTWSWSMETAEIAAEACTSLRSTSEAIGRLERAGLIVVERAHRQQSLYRVTMAADHCGPKPKRNDARREGGGAVFCTQHPARKSQHEDAGIAASCAQESALLHAESGAASTQETARHKALLNCTLETLEKTQQQAVASAAELRKLGLKINSHHPDLVAAVSEGVTASSLVELAHAYPGKGAPYLIAIARRQRAEGASQPPTARNSRRESAAERCERVNRELDEAEARDWSWLEQDEALDRAEQVERCIAALAAKRDRERLNLPEKMALAQATTRLRRLRERERTAGAVIEGEAREVGTWEGEA